MVCWCTLSISNVIFVTPSFLCANTKGALWDIPSLLSSHPHCHLAYPLFSALSREHGVILDPAQMFVSREQLSSYLGSLFRSSRCYNHLIKPQRHLITVLSEPAWNVLELRTQNSVRVTVNIGHISADTTKQKTLYVLKYSRHHLDTYDNNSRSHLVRSWEIRRVNQLWQRKILKLNLKKGFLDWGILQPNLRERRLTT